MARGEGFQRLGPTADFAKFAKDPKYSVVDKVSNRVIYVHLNQRDNSPPPFVTGKVGKPLAKNPLKDLRVRKALSIAINRDAIADRVMEKRAVPAGQLLPDFFFGTSKKLKPAKYDPEGAKKLLAEAGYPAGFAMTIHGTNNRYINDDKVAQAIAQFYTRIGIDAKVETMPASVYFTRATKGDFSYMQLGWGTESGEQGSSLRSLLATYDQAKGMGVTNRALYSNPELDSLISQLHLSLPLPSRFRQYDVTSQSYRVYALVRGVVPVPGEAARVGVLFYGRHPPHGAESLPGGLFLIEGDQRPVSPGRGVAVVLLQLRASQAPGGQEREEQAVVEHVTARGARVRVTSLPVMKGILLGVEEIGGAFKAEARVEHVLIGPDGHPRADLVFLDGLAPESWGAAEG